jgi:hypothetical protein
MGFGPDRNNPNMKRVIQQKSLFSCIFSQFSLTVGREIAQSDLRSRMEDQVDSVDVELAALSVVPLESCTLLQLLHRLIQIQSVRTMIYREFDRFGPWIFVFRFRHQ